MPTKALIFSAPSGSGKTTIVRHLLQKFPNLSFSISATTRAPRGQEVNGNDYYFLSNETFDEKIAKGDLLEWEEVYEGLKYGTLNSEVDRIWAEGKVVVFDVDVIGGLNLKKKLGEKALAVFVKAPSLEIIADRLRSRNTDSDQALQMRIAKVQEELDQERHFDVTIVNDQLDVALQDTESQISKFLAP